MIIIIETLSLFHFCQSSGTRQNSVKVVVCPPSLYTCVNFGLLKIFTFKNEMYLLYHERNFWAMWGLFCAVHYHWFTVVPTGFQPHSPGHLKRLLFSSNTIIFFDITAKWKKKLIQLFSHWKMLFHQTGLKVLDLFIFSLKILKFAGFTLL